MKSTLAELTEKVNPAHTALLLVDLQNDFCSEEAIAKFINVPDDVAKANAYRKQRSAVVSQLREFVESVRKTNVKLVFIQLLHDDRWFSNSPLAQRQKSAGARCKVGTWGADFVEGIRPTESDFLVTKYCPSAFIGTNLDLLLRTLGMRTLVLCGGATNICVGTTALDGSMLGYNVVVIRDLSTGQYDLHESALTNIDRNFGEVVSSAELLKIWRDECLQETTRGAKEVSVGL